MRLRIISDISGCPAGGAHRSGGRGSRRDHLPRRRGRLRTPPRALLGDCAGQLLFSHRREPRQGARRHRSPRMDNPFTDSALRWTRERLDDEDLGGCWRCLFRCPRRRDPLCHGARKRRTTTFSRPVTLRTLLASACGIILCGHTHRPMACDINSRRQCTWLHWCDGDVVPLEKGHPYAFNPGSVGQPRDNDSRAYAVSDLARQSVASCSSTRSATQRAMRVAAYPSLRNAWPREFDRVSARPPASPEDASAHRGLSLLMARRIPARGVWRWASALGVTEMGLNGHRREAG